MISSSGSTGLKAQSLVRCGFLLRSLASRSLSCLKLLPLISTLGTRESRNSRTLYSVHWYLHIDWANTSAWNSLRTGWTKYCSPGACEWGSSRPSPGPPRWSCSLPAESGPAGPGWCLCPYRSSSTTGTGSRSSRNGWARRWPSSLLCAWCGSSQLHRYPLLGVGCTLAASSSPM